MAENAVHISSTEHSKPTIFELWAQDSLMGTLEPAFKIICDILGAKNFTRYQWLLKWHDEAFLALNLFLQYQYLNKYHASFSEAFYSLKRVPLTGETLTQRLKLKSLLSLVLVPYFISKLKSYMDKLKQEQIVNENNNKHVEISIKAILAFINSMNFYYSLRYMTGRSRTHTILDHWSEIEITHNARMDSSWGEIFQDFKSNPRKMAALLSLCFKLSSKTLELSAFFIQFLNWWNTHQFNTSIGALPIPEPPSCDIAYNNMCPICSNPRKAEVALQPSGFVFCYPCIKQYLDEEGKCPVSNIPATTRDLIRLYTD